MGEGKKKEQQRKGCDMRRIATGCAIFLFGCFLLLGSAEAGWMIHSQYGGPSGTSEKEVVYFQRDKVREESGGQTTVMDFASRQIIMVQDKEKKYSVMTFDEFKKMMRESMGKAREAMEEMKRQGYPVPGAPSPQTGAVTVAGIGKATVAGYPCDGYRVSRGGVAAEDVWVTRKIDPTKELGPAVWKEFEDLSREAKKMGFDAKETENDSAYRKILESGYPMKTVDKRSGNVHEVTRVENKALSASLFAEPQGYRNVPYDRLFGDPGDRERAGKAEPPAGAAGVTGQAADYGRQTAEEAKDAASRGAQEPVQEKKREGLDSIRKGASEGIKKLFKW